MRCHEVLRELAVPTDARDSAAIDEHLGRCPACAAWAERAQGLDRLWKATQPPEPTPQTWDALWADLTGSLDASVPETLVSLALSGSRNGSPNTPLPKAMPERSSRSHLRNLAVIGLIGLAQAAAVFLAVGLTLNGSDPSQMAKGTNPAVVSLTGQPENVAAKPSLAVLGTVEVEAGQLVVVMIRNQGKSATIIDRTPEVTFLEVDDMYLLHSAMESEAKPKVAMK
jgi:anti-sigma factor RsiW